MKIKIDFGYPYFDEETIFKLSLKDLDDFYTDENDVNRLNLFYIDKALELDERPEYRQWKEAIDEDLSGR